MGHTCRLVVSTVMAVLTTVSSAGAEQRRLITVEDCVKTKRILMDAFGQSSPVQLSPDGSHVAYVVKSPNVVTNRNNYQVYVRDLNHFERRDNGRLTLQADRISGIKWISSNQLVAQVGRKSDKGMDSELDIVSTTTGEFTKLQFPVPVDTFSISSNGKIVAFSSPAMPELPQSTAQSKQQSREERGYPIIFGKGRGDANEWTWSTRKYDIYLGKITREGKIEATKLYFSGPGAAPRRSSLSRVTELKLSPDGNYLLLNYSADSPPDEWLQHPVIKELSGFGTRAETYVLGLYEIATGRLHLAFNYPGMFLKASWADDSQAYSVISPSPFGSDEEKKETEAAGAFGRLYFYLYRFNHLFAVDVNTGNVTKVVYRDSGQAGNAKFQFDAPLVWKSSDEMIVRAADNSFAKMKLSEEKWKEFGRIEIPQDGSFKSLFASDGRVLLGVSQAPTIPPDLLVEDLTTGQSRLITDLNPEYRSIALGEVEKIEWTNRYGSKCTGKLIRPVGYEPGKRYPLVVMANDTDSDEFISDAVHTTAFAPQSLANAGFAVLMAKYPKEDKFSRGEFPGDMGQAYNWMSMMETAIDLLAGKGFVDPDQVGVVGFSRTSWLTDFMLTHTTRNFKAASSADSGIYTYGGYFRYNLAQQMKGDETQLGGSPFGDTWKYWLKYAPAFNAERVRAPLLMEYTKAPDGALEFFVALNRLGKPVELYCYPNGTHPLDTPFERIASLQRNVDWFRFWMQGYEGKAPDYDPDQYVHWRKLREQQQWNARIRTEGKEPTTEFLRQTAPGTVAMPQNRAPAAIMQP